MGDLLPKPPRRMKQPTKALLRVQLVTALDQNEWLQRALASLGGADGRAASPLILAAASWWRRKPYKAQDANH